MTSIWVQLAVSDDSHLLTETHSSGVLTNAAQQCEWLTHSHRTS
jgi:hypothetical protein